MEALHSREDRWIAVFFFLASTATRIPFMSSLLYSMDSANFALALDDFNVSIHQPHPPGYFLYVMFGRLLHLFLGDANRVFVTISILFSGLTVATLYVLGKELFDRKTGILAAAIGITSPLLWFHGEVALTYAIEAFYSTFIALFCWRVTKGETVYLWFSALAMGIAGGFRQVTPIFLFPLWFHSVKGMPLRKIVLSFTMMVITVLVWFLPMLRMTGGWDAYYRAFLELWTYNTGNFTVFENGWPALELYSYTLFRFLVYGVGTWIFPLVLAFYLLVRQGRIGSLDRGRSLFLFLWALPSILFYLLVFIQPANPGYSLIFMPVIFIVAACSLEYVCTDLQRFLKRNLVPVLATLLILLNACWFLQLKTPVSNKVILGHERDLGSVLGGIKSFSPQDTAIIVAKPYVFFSFRHIMYYLPEYTVYQIDERSTATGQRRKTFWGVNRETRLTDGIDLPGRFEKVAVLLDEEDCVNIGERVETRKRVGNSGLCVVSGPVELLETIFAGMGIFSSTERREDLLWTCVKGKIPPRKGIRGSFPA